MMKKALKILAGIAIVGTVVVGINAVIRAFDEDDDWGDDDDWEDDFEEDEEEGEEAGKSEKGAAIF